MLRAGLDCRRWLHWRSPMTIPTPHRLDGQASGTLPGRAMAALSGPWASVVVVAGLAILAGLLIPNLLSSDTVIDNETPKNTKKGVASSEYKPPSLPEAPNPQALLGRLFAGTLIVLGLSVVSIWVMRRW